jgi:hypothetical protein
MRPFAALFVSVYFGAVALYSLTLAFRYDPLCLPLYFQAGLSIASAIGLFTVKRWSLWLSAVSLPPIIVIELSALNFSTGVSGFGPNWSTLIFNISYVVIAILALLSLLLLADKRHEFK